MQTLLRRTCGLRWYGEEEENVKDLPEMLDLYALEEFLARHGYRRARPTLTKACREIPMGQKFGRAWVVTKAEALAYLESLDRQES